MKHLKKIFESKNNSSPEAMKEVFEPHIDKELIQDMLDMSSEHIDNGMSLYVEIGYVFNTDNWHMEIALMDIDMYEVREQYQSLDYHYSRSLKNGVYDLEPIDPSKITYRLFFTKDSMLQKTKELVNRLITAHPHLKGQLSRYK